MPLLTERHCTILCFLDIFFLSSKTAEQNYIRAGLTTSCRIIIMCAKNSIQYDSLMLFKFFCTYNLLLCVYDSLSMINVTSKKLAMENHD